MRWSRWHNPQPPTPNPDPHVQYFWEFHGVFHIFITALGSLSAMIAYPVAIITVEDLGPHRYAEGYGYGWGAVASYLTSSIYMLLDDLYRWLREVDCCRASQRETDGERTKRWYMSVRKWYTGRIVCTFLYNFCKSKRTVCDTICGKAFIFAIMDVKRLSLAVGY